MSKTGRPSLQHLELPSSSFRDSDIEEFFDIDGASAPTDLPARDQSGSLTEELLQTVGHSSTPSPSPGPLPSNVTVSPAAGGGSSALAPSTRLQPSSVAAVRELAVDVEEGRLRQSKCASFEQMP